MLTVGIVGQMGTGKSTVAQELVHCGGVLVSGDKIGREVVESNLGVKKRLVSAFGISIVGRGGIIDREKLAGLAFGSEESLATLNQIVHPPLLKELRRQIKAAKRERLAPMVVVDAALIFYWGLQRDLDATILVDAPRQSQLKWLRAKGVNRRDALGRIRLQMPKYRQRKLATYQIRNSGSQAELRAKARKLYQTLIDAK